MSNTQERITKLATKLSQIDDRMSDLTTQRQQICDEITDLIQQKTATTGPTAAKTAPIKPSKAAVGGETMGSKILQILEGVPTGQTLSDLANKLKITPQRVSLAIHHLKQAGRVFQSGNLYVTATPMTVAAKTAPTVPMGPYISPDDEID